MSNDVPKRVSVRTDPEKGLAHRYDDGRVVFELETDE